MTGIETGCDVGNARVPVTDVDIATDMAVETSQQPTVRSAVIAT